MIYILLFAVFFLCGTSLVLARNMFEFKGLAKNTSSLDGNLPLVSICVPARNEETVIERCVSSCLNQNYPNLEILVLNDSSTDKTGVILNALSLPIPNLNILEGRPKPEDWLGKPWACHQLSEAAQGEILVFIDADVWIEPDAISKMVYEFRYVDALTVWPQQKLGSFWENLVVPNIYFALLTFLPAVYVERKPRWMPFFLGKTLNTKFAAACGQFVAFKRETYSNIDGHRGVKDQIVEDMELARNLKTAGLKLRMMHGIHSVYCRMYTSGSEIWKGFEKNFLAGFNNLLGFVLMGTLHFLVFIYPIFSLVYGIGIENISLVVLSVSTLVIFIIQRATLSIWFGWNPVYSLLHSASVLWFQILALNSIFNRIFGIKASWKGRHV